MGLLYDACLTSRYAGCFEQNNTLKLICLAFDFNVYTVVDYTEHPSMSLGHFSNIYELGRNGRYEKISNIILI